MGRKWPVVFFAVWLSFCMGGAVWLLPVGGSGGWTETIAYAAERESAAAGPAPDYAAASSWAYFAVGPEHPVDLFILAPTVYGGSAQAMNMSLADTVAKQNFLGALNMEIGIYDGDCRLYAPYYRQAGLAAYSAGGAALSASLDVAAADAERAFRYYLSVINPDRPFVLAGFSQGSEILLRLMKNCLTTPELQDRLVAAYAIGWRLTARECADYPQLRPAQGKHDLGVIVSFNSEAEDVQQSLPVPFGVKTLAINPLNWRTDSVPASADQNLGACFTDYSGGVKDEIPLFCGAYLDPRRGTLKVTGISPEQYPPLLSLFAPGVYHVYDYQFFYRNLQQNVHERIEAYQIQKAQFFVSEENAA